MTGLPGLDLVLETGRSACGVGGGGGVCSRPQSGREGGAGAAEAAVSARGPLPRPRKPTFSDSFRHPRPRRHFLTQRLPRRPLGRKKGKRERKKSTPGLATGGAMIESLQFPLPQAFLQNACQSGHQLVSRAGRPGRRWDRTTGGGLGSRGRRQTTRRCRRPCSQSSRHRSAG